MEMFGNILCISYPELINNGLMTVPSYKKKLREGRLVIVRQGKGKGNSALIAYNSLPDNTRVACDENERIKAEKEAMKEREEKKMVDSLKFDANAVKFFKEYKSSKGIGIDTKKQLEYLLNAQVMDAMVLIEHKRKTEHTNGPRKKNVWASVLFNCEKLREKYNHTLPNNEARLREKFNAYKRLGYEALINKNTGNQVARRIGDLEANLLLKLRRSVFPVYTDQQIFDEFNRQAPLRNMKTIKRIETMHKFLNEPKIMVYWYPIIYGERAFKDKFFPKNKTILPSIPNSLWNSDGTRLNLYYREYVENKGWVVKATDVYEVMDVATEMLLGYHIADGETFDIQFAAYRDAITKWNVKPYEIVTDNQAGGKSESAMEFYSKICHLRKVTMPHNGQSKTIENAFGRFQQQILHKYWFFSGQNITAKSQKSRANIDLITRNKDKLPTLEEVKAIYAQCREEWNNSVCAISDTGMTRKELYTSIDNPEAQHVDESEYAEIFKLYSDKPVKYCDKGFEFQLRKKEYSYMVYEIDGTVDMTFHMSNIGKSFYYRYDPNDMTRIELWEDTATGKKFAAIATPKVAIHRATQERTHEENEFLYAQLEKDRAIKASISIVNEELYADDNGNELYRKLNPAKPVGLSGKQMDYYREQMKNGKLAPPVTFERKELPELPIEIDFSREAIVSSGDYTKKVSKITDIDIYDRY